MIISAKSNPILSQVFDWIISILVTIIILGVGVKWWDQYSGTSGFVKDVLGILTTSIPVPFWIAVLLGVALSVSFYRERVTYKKYLESKK